MPNATWQFLINWDRDGDYTDPYDDITTYVKQATFSVGFRSPRLSVADEMQCTFRLDNVDKRFSPENTSGTLYGKLLPMRPVRIQSVYAGGTVIQWQGFVETIQPDWNARAQREATITATGPKFLLEKSQALIPVMQNATSDEIISELLAKVEMPPPYLYSWYLGVSTNDQSKLGVGTYLRDSGLTKSLETGRQTFSYIGDTWQDDTSVSRAIGSVVQAERGKFFFSRSGVATFYNRHHFLTDTTNDGTVNNTMQGMNYVFGEDIANIVRARIKPRVVSESADQIIWQLDKPITIKGLTSKTIRARFSAQDSDSKVAAITVVPPKRGTTLLSTSRVDLVTFTYTATSAEIELYNPRHREAEVTVITLLGQKVTTYNDVIVEERNGESIYQYTKRELDLDLGVLDNETSARSIVKYELSLRANAAGEVRSIMLLNQNSTTLTQMINHTVGDRIQIIETQTGQNEPYFIVGVEHVVSEAQKLHQTTWYLEKADKTRYWILNRTGWGELGSTTRLAPL